MSVWIHDWFNRNPGTYGDTGSTPCLLGRSWLFSLFSRVCCLIYFLHSDSTWKKFVFLPKALDMNLLITILVCLKMWVSNFISIGILTNYSKGGCSPPSGSRWTFVCFSAGVVLWPQGRCVEVWSVAVYCNANFYTWGSRPMSEFSKITAFCCANLVIG